MPFSLRLQKNSTYRKQQQRENYRIIGFPENLSYLSTQNPYISLFYRGLETYKIEWIKEFEFKICCLIRYRNQYDGVHFHWLEYCGNKITGPIRLIAMLFVLRVLQKKIIWTCHNFSPHAGIDIFGKCLNIIVANYAHLIICHSIEVKKKLAKITFNKEKIVYTPHFVYGDIYPNQMSREEARKLLGIPSDAQVYLFFGLIRKYKGVEDLVKAFLANNDNKSLLYIVGLNFMGNFLEKAIPPGHLRSKDIRPVFKFVGNNELQIYMNASDALVYPFRKVDTSGSFMLAYGFKKPVIVRDSPLSREVFDADTAVYFTDNASLIPALEKVRQLDLIRVARRFTEKEFHLTLEETLKEVGPRYQSLFAGKSSDTKKGGDNY